MTSTTKEGLELILLSFSLFPLVSNPFLLKEFTVMETYSKKEVTETEI